ncbi:MAG: hypothetical protein ACKPKE_18295 [Microcystis panniformis]|uniref:Uncharacterized protein n=1 Tax=Microcystis aeruginosa PCC 9807 TaxID=1160283 RepID=I4H1V7_MICAE|nr:hypothetical protein [Microcystis aeruginosa]CCI16031.1 hypothetical protein MICAF_1730009 [Microcystis aeruginosa PCC 9807]
MLIFNSKAVVERRGFRPKIFDEPYQVNLFIGGVNHFGKTYTVTVVGCYR